MGKHLEKLEFPCQWPWSSLWICLPAELTCSFKGSISLPAANWENADSAWSEVWLGHFSLWKIATHRKWITLWKYASFDKCINRKEHKQVFTEVSLIFWPACQEPGEVLTSRFLEELKIQHLFDFSFLIYFLESHVDTNTFQLWNLKQKNLNLWNLWNLRVAPRSPILTSGCFELDI